MIRKLCRSLLLRCLVLALSGNHAANVPETDAGDAHTRSTLTTARHTLEQGLALDWKAAFLAVPVQIAIGAGP